MDLPWGKAVTRKGRLHSAQKPVPLLEYLIETYSIEGDTVLDCAMGSGSTGVACMRTNREFIGIEKDRDTFRVAATRIEEAAREAGGWASR